MGGVVDAVVDVVETVVDFVVDVVEEVVDFVGDVISFVLNPFGAQDAPDVPDPGQAAQGVTVTKNGTNVAIPVVYGHRRVGGSIVYVETNGETNKYLYVVYALCEGEIEGVSKILVDDVELPGPSSTVYAQNSTIDVTSGRFSGRLKFQIKNGADNQSANTLANETATWKNKRRRLPGIAYVTMRFEWKKIETQEDADNNPYRGGIPQVKFDVLGKKIFDVRTHTAGQTQLSNDYGSLSKAYNFNPANCLLDYMMNPRYGVGIPKEQIDADSFRTAARKLEQRVNYSNNQRGRAMTCNAVVSTGAKCLDNVKTLTAGARAIMPFVQGRYKIKIEDGGNATDITSTTVQIAYDVDSSVVIGGISLDGERKKSKYNQVIVNYVDPDLEFTNQQVVHNVAGDQTIDQEEELTGEFTFHTLTNPAIARDLAQMIYDKSRKQRQISFTASQELLDIEVGDIIRVTDTVLDLNLQTFRVVSVKLKNNGQVAIQATEHDATLYPFTTGAQVELPPPLFLPDVFYIKPYVRPLPKNPTSIKPIFDPDYDSAGAIIEDVDDTTPPPPPPDDIDDPGDIVNPVPDPPQPPPTVTEFENFDIAHNGSFYLGVSDPTRIFDVPDLGGFKAPGTRGIVNWNQDYFPFFSVFDMVQIRTFAQAKFAQFRVVLPANAQVNRFDVIRYDTQGNIAGKDQFGIPNGYAVNRGNERIDKDSGLAHPTNIMMNLGRQGDRLQMRWVNSDLGLEYIDGSDFTDMGFASFTYKRANGQLITGSNIEALLNYLNDYAWGETTASTNVTFSQNLGA